MAATFVNNLRVAEPADGDSNWGNTTNTSLELIGEALGYGTEAITTNADTHTSTVADGSTDPARAMYLKYTGTLDSACTITIGPNTIKRFQIIENATSGSQSIIISQGSGANVTIAAGGVKAVYLDGAGSGAAVVDAFVDLDVGGTFTVGTAANGVSITNGAIDLKNSGSASYMRFYCESSNAHYAEIKSAAHAAYSGNVTLTLPVTTSNLVGDSATQTLTNKTINASNNTLSNIPMSATALSAGTGLSLSTNTLSVDAAQTGITSLLATDIKIGEDNETKIDFEDADKINFYAGNEKQLILEDGALYPGTDNIIDLGKSDNEFKDAFFDGTVTADAFAGPLTGDVTGNVSGTAATVTGAAQSNITSLGTLTTLTVDNVIINGTTIGHTDDTDLLTVADGVLTVAGEVSMTTLDIGGTNVTATAAELNKLDGVGVLKQAGLETIYVPAAAMYPNSTSGCAALAQVELANGPELKCLDFDASSDENAQFTVCFPKSWNEGTVTFQAFWTVTGTNTGTVAWGLSGGSIADDASINTAFGTNVVATAKAFSGTSNDMTVSATSGAVTIANAAADTMTYFQIMRDVSADDQTGDARLLGIKLFFTTDAANDA